MVTKLQPAVVLMDINLPRMDGITAARHIKTNYPNIAVVGFSMTVHSYSEHAMLKAGAFAVLPKDKAVHDLYATIQLAVASVQPVVILKDPALGTEALSESAASLPTDLPIEQATTANENEEEQ